MSKKDDRIAELHTLVGSLTVDNRELLDTNAGLRDIVSRLRNQATELETLRQKHTELQDQYTVANEVIRELRETQAKLESDFDAAMRVIDATLPERFSRR